MQVKPPHRRRPLVRAPKPARRNPLKMKSFRVVGVDDSVNTLPLSAPADDLLPQGDRELMQIYSFLKRHQGVDFTHYKQTTLRRRIQRRMLIHRAKTVKDYIKILETHPAEGGLFTRIY